MASIFLSYAREDATKARTLAKALERAGHAVWWDRQIFGGSEFSDEIEAALKNADVVIVLWSEAAVRSAWVRDEAAEGRESGRLVPIMLEACLPPLGFRQVQSVSLAGWQGRGNPPHMQEILHAVAMRAGKETSIAVPAGKSGATSPRRALLLALGFLGALLAAVGGWWLLEGRGEASETPVLAVLPFSDLSPEGDKAYFAEGVAEAILTVLAKEPGIRVVGRSTARQLHNAGNDAGKMRKALGVTHILEGTARSVGDQLRMSVRLVDAEDGQQLWSEEYRRRLDNVFAVQDEIGRAVAQRLKGSFTAAGQAAQQLTSADAYTLYLAARAKMRDRRLPALKEALAMARKVIAADPNYAPGHALYAELIWHMSVDNYGNIPLERARELAAPYARRAVQLAPKASEGHAALGVVSTGEDAVQSLARAIRLDPARAELRLWIARRLEFLGRNDEGLEHLRAATEMDPLFAPAMWNHVWWLAASGRTEEAQKVIKEFERRGGSAGVAARTRADLAGFYSGDFSEGIRFGEAALRADPETPIGREVLAWYYQRVGLLADASRFAGNLPAYSRLWISGDYRRLAERASHDGPKLWEQPDYWAGIDALALHRDWRAIERLFDLHPKRAALCKGMIWDLQPTLTIAAALAARSRSAESRELRECVASTMTILGRSPVRSQGSPAPVLDMTWAGIRALEGRQEEAFSLLDRAIRGGVRSGYGRGMSMFPAFDRYRSSTQYQAGDRRLKELIARERAETLAWKRRLV